MRERDLAARFIANGWEGHIHAFKHGKAVVRRLRRIRKLRQHALARSIQRIRPAAANILHHVPIGGKAFLLHIRGKPFRRDGKDLRR